MAKTITITVFEHQSLRVGQQGFTDPHRVLLERFRGDSDEEVFPYYSLIHNGVKFKHYVGVLNVGGLQIEVLPKVDRSTQGQDTWRTHLLTMLRTVYRLQAKTPSNANQALKDSPVLDVFLQRFLAEVETLLHIGLIKTYRKETDNLNALKGKIVWSKHVTKNVVHKERFFVNYTSYDRNHIMNRIIYKTLQVIPEVTRNSYIANRSKTLAFEFPELLDINVTDATFATMHFDRKSDGYRDAMQIAKLILLNYMPDHMHHRNNVLALMFDMNRLWEEYVYVVLRRELKDFNVTAQSSKRFWAGENTSIKHIRPDIVISNNEGAKLVIDTKWKCPYENAPSDADLKQMYVYHKYWDVNHTILLYPSAGGKDTVTGTFNNPSCDDGNKLTCSMVFVSITEENKILTTEKINNLFNDMSQTGSYELSPLKKEEMPHIVDYVTQTTRMVSLEKLGEDITNRSFEEPVGFIADETGFCWWEFSVLPNLGVRKIIDDIATHFPDVEFVMHVISGSECVYMAKGQGGQWDEMKCLAINVFIGNDRDYSRMAGIIDTINAIDGVEAVTPYNVEHMVRIQLTELTEVEFDRVQQEVTAIISTALPEADLPCVLLHCDKYRGEDALDKKTILKASMCQWQEIPVEQRQQIDFNDYDDQGRFILKPSNIKILFN